MKNCYDKTVSVTQMLKDVGWELLDYSRSTQRINLLNKFRESWFSEDVADMIRPHPTKAVQRLKYEK